MIIGNVIEKVHITGGHSDFGGITFDLNAQMQGANYGDGRFIAVIHRIRKL